MARKITNLTIYFNCYLALAASSDKNSKLLLKLSDRKMQWSFHDEMQYNVPALDEYTSSRFACISHWDWNFPLICMYLLATMWNIAPMLARAKERNACVACCTIVANLWTLTRLQHVLLSASSIQYKGIILVECLEAWLIVLNQYSQWTF